LWPSDIKYNLIIDKLRFVAIPFGGNETSKTQNSIVTSQGQFTRSTKTVRFAIPTRFRIETLAGSSPGKLYKLRDVFERRGI